MRPSGAGPAGRSTATAARAASRSPRPRSSGSTSTGLARPIGCSSCCRAARPCSSWRRTSTMPSDAAAERDAQARRILDWLASAPAADATDRPGRLQRRSRPSRPTPGCAAPVSGPRTLEAMAREPAVTWPSGLAGAGDGHRRRPGLPRLHLGPRRRSRSSTRVSSSIARTRRTRRSTRATTSASAPTWRSARRVAAMDRAARTLRLAHRGDWRHAPGEHVSRRCWPPSAVPGCDGLEFDVRAVARRRPGAAP